MGLIIDKEKTYTYDEVINILTNEDNSVVFIDVTEYRRLMHAIILSNFRAKEIKDTSTIAFHSEGPAPIGGRLEDVPYRNDLKYLKWYKAKYDDRLAENWIGKAKRNFIVKLHLKDKLNRIYVQDDFIYVNQKIIDIYRKDVNGISYMYDKETNDRLIVNHKYRNLYIVKGKITQMVVIYKDTIKLTVFDTKDLGLVIKQDWIYKHDANGGGIYCTAEKIYLHYYLYDPDKSYRDLRHIDKDRLNNTKFNISLYDDDDILPVGVYYNKTSDIYVAKYVFEGETYDEVSFPVNQYGEDARELAIDKMKKMTKRYAKLGLSKEKPNNKKPDRKKNNEDDGWV